MKIAVLGDSISQGLGSKRINYVDSLVRNLRNNGISATVSNFALTGTTINYVSSIMNEIENYHPDCVFIFYGNVEAIIRPDLRKNTIVTKLMPQRYHKMFMLDPRPFYSRFIIKKTVQHLDNAYRYIMRRIVSKSNGVYRLMEPEEFRREYLVNLEKLKSIAKLVICCSNVNIDEHYFPGTTKSLEEFRKVIQEISSQNNLPYIPLDEWQRKFAWREIYGNDHYHPNENGYENMGEFFANKIAECAKNIV